MPPTLTKKSRGPTHALPHATGRSTAILTAWLVLLTLLTTLLLGYHPFAEDGGIYAAAIEARLNPHLFSHDHLWVTAHTRFALFVPLAATATRALHLSVATILLVFQTAGIFALLAAAAHLARTCFPGQQHPWLATVAVAAGAGLPVAGTALYAVDPYCTARTVTTPLLLFAFSFALRRRWPACVLCWALAATMHPLMALWAALPLTLVAALATRHPRRWTVLLIASAFLTAALLLAIAAPETAATRVIAHTRAYWFPEQWRWFEWTGAAAPCILLTVLQRRFRLKPGDVPDRLITAITTTTVITSALALCFAREAAASLTIARLQPMRSLHLVFFVFLIATGAILQTRLHSTRQRLFAIGTCALVATSVFAMQRSLYAHTPHLEWPSATPANPWQAAFLWCRDHTPPDALFALDANYINQPGEDSHGFRATALRSTLPDNVKDAGIAAVLPALTPSWQRGVSATANLNSATDTERRDRLLPLGVTWIVLPAAANTALLCPYRNNAAQVCRLL